MKTQRKLIKRWGAALRALLVDRRANSMFLTAAAVVPIMGLVGSGVDIGRAYMAELRLQQACDAGVLAGRRAMTGSTYGSGAIAEANKMFNFNYPADTYGSTNIVFASQAQGASNVSGSATVKLPSTIMKVFNFSGFDLAVACAAKLEISNVDVMLVLDVTGSMAQTNSGDSVNRITALKDASVDFFDTMTTADIGDGRLRFGVVPYSSSANVGQILLAKNPAWLSDNVLLPSRTPIFRVEYGSGTTTYSDPVDGSTSYGNWSNISTINGYNSSTCGGVEPPSDTSPSASGSPSSNQTGQYVNGDGNRVTTYNNNQTYAYYNYRYVWSNSRCRLQRRTATYTRTTASTTTEVPTQVFDNRYTYQDRVFDVSLAKTGSALVTDTGNSGASVSSFWGGCILERATEPFASNQAAPADAYDMDVDSAPTSDDDTKWKLLIPDVSFPRSASPGTTNPPTGAVNVASSSVTGTNWANYVAHQPNGWGVCPAAAQKLTTMTAADRSAFTTYINSLQPVGGTYHDSGFVWGVRLLSADGMFADENTTSPNGRPISRHIVFMTDGAMAPNRGNLTFQGYEPTMLRIGGTSDTALRDRHNNRFLQLCEAAKGKNITVWVIGFGVALNTELTTCASAGKSYQAANAAQLNDAFQSIARQISKLRLSQ